MEPISLSEYAQECESVARAVVEECEGDDDAIHNRLHATIASHQWIIYTYYNLQVLQHSKNDGAYFEEYGALTADDFADAVSKMAFAAFMADVREELDSALEWYKEKNQCQSGEATGRECEGLRRVKIEFMPEHLRESHTAAGNSGVFPHNGALRLHVCEECASMLCEDAEWCNEVSK